MYDCIIIGAGPAGYSAAIRAGQLGMKTVLVEQRKIGGMCLNWGCVPARGMLAGAKVFAAVQKASEFGVELGENVRPSFSWNKALVRTQKISEQLTGNIGKLMTKYAVETVKGNASVTGPGLVSINNRALESRNILIATGSLPGAVSKEAADAVEAGGGKCIDIPRLFQKQEFADSITIYGAGPVAVEIAELFALLGKQVHFALQGKDILPGFDDVLKNAVIQQLSAYGISVSAHLPVKVKTLINCALRRPVLPEMKMKCAQDENGFIEIDRWCRTSIEGMYAAGDITGTSFLALPASMQGVTAVNHMAGIRRDDDRFLYPLTVYSVPELAQAGLTEREVKERGYSYKTANYTFSVNAKALAEGNAEGFVRVLYEEKIGEVLGVQIAGSNASDMISEALAVIRAEGTVFDLSTIVHAHPSSSELFIDLHEKGIGDSGPASD